MGVGFFLQAANSQHNNANFARQCLIYLAARPSATYNSYALQKLAAR